MALSASTALPAAQAAEQLGHDALAIAAMSSYQHGRERIDGPIASLIFMAALRHRLEGVSGGDDDVADAVVGAARRCSVTRAMRDGIAITERSEFGTSAATRPAVPFVNELSSLANGSTRRRPSAPRASRHRPRSSMPRGGFRRRWSTTAWWW
jgi:hypothetical protein